MKLRTLNKRKKRKLFGVSFPNAALRRVLLCNRFAATAEGKTRVFAKDDPSERRYFNEEFYAVKDMLLARFGRRKGLALQHWTSKAYDGYDDYIGINDGAHHYHILDIVKLGKAVLHCPTGHFSFSNDLNGYYKRTIGFDDAAKLCTQKIEGRKKIRVCNTTKPEAIRALNWLISHYVRRLKLTPKEKPVLKVKTGNYENEYLEAWFRREQEAKLEKQKVTPAMCAWCLKSCMKIDVTDFAGRDFCAGCYVKITRVERRASIGAVNEIPF